MRVVPLVRLVLDVRRGDRDASRFLFGRLVDLVKRDGVVDSARLGFGKNFGDRGREAGLAMIDVADRADVDVRLGAVVAAGCGGGKRAVLLKGSGEAVLFFAGSGGMRGCVRGGARARGKIGARGARPLVGKRRAGARVRPPPLSLSPRCAIASARSFRPSARQRRSARSRRAVEVLLRSGSPRVDVHARREGARGRGTEGGARWSENRSPSTPTPLTVPPRPARRAAAPPPPTAAAGGRAPPRRLAAGTSLLV